MKGILDFGKKASEAQWMCVYQQGTNKIEMQELEKLIFRHSMILKRYGSFLFLPPAEAIEI
ncbi:hypothetical protein RE476_03620 [Methanolobus mangrovi]|uniref:Uncharacterized protein n=1 Tax=Methanolobus mangrovi TaxID=3072977 RepID=A0AA51YK82_9EURY|nr:hypothetical protein [Methanolobus mangrovi]WMW22924.1 hypothetical protein RE476_03620 [Methanolobus mangrovi]